MFANKTVEAIARILAVTVLLDHRQRDREMIEFCHYVMTINQDICSVAILPRQTILTWFDAHKAEFEAALTSDADGSFKAKILEPITDPTLRKQVLTAVFAICICDYEFRDEEAEFIKIALDLWKSDMPTIDDVSKMAG